MNSGKYHDVTKVTQVEDHSSAKVLRKSSPSYFNRDLNLQSGGILILLFKQWNICNITCIHEMSKEHNFPLSDVVYSNGSSSEEEGIDEV